MYRRQWARAVRHQAECTGTPRLKRWNEKGWRACGGYVFACREIDVATLLVVMQLPSHAILRTCGNPARSTLVTRPNVDRVLSLFLFGCVLMHEHDIRHTYARARHGFFSLDVAPFSGERLKTDRPGSVCSRTRAGSASPVHPNAKRDVIEAWHSTPGQDERALLQKKCRELRQAKSMGRTETPVLSSTAIFMPETNINL
jgi:hypothetical protein